MNNTNLLRLNNLFLFFMVVIACAGCASVPQPDNPPTATLKFTDEAQMDTPTTLSESTPTETPTPNQPQIRETETKIPILTPTSSHLLAIGPFVPLDDSADRPKSEIRALFTGPKKNIWVIGSGDVTSYDGDTWQSHGEVTGHPLGFDGLGRLWIVDTDGEWITAYDGESWLQYGPEQGWLPAGWMFNVEMYASVSDGLVTDSKGDTWLVTSNDIRILHEDKWTILEPEEIGYTPTAFMLEYEFDYQLSDVAIDSTGDVWVTDCAWMGPGPEGQGARWFDGETWMGQSSPVVATGCIKDIEMGADGRIWAGVDDALWRYTPGEGWEELQHAVSFPMEGLRWGWIIDLLLDGTDAVWETMVPCGGASCDIGRSITFWISDTETLIVGEDGVPDIAKGANGLTWGCFAHGLHSVAAGEFITVVDDLPAPCQVEADATGRVWLAISGQSELWIFDAP